MNPVLSSFIAFLLALLGSYTLYSALWKDRAKGRMRCPKCWYSMDGAPLTGQPVCPECGHVAPTSKSLLRTRRSWGRAFLAILIFLAAYGAREFENLRSGAWPRSIPAPLLVLIAPPNHAPQGLPNPKQQQVQRLMLIPSAPGLTPPTVKERLTQEAWERIAEGRINHALGERFLRRVIPSSPLYTPTKWTYLPPKWPKGRPVPVYFSAGNRAWSLDFTSIGPRGITPKGQADTWTGDEVFVWTVPAEQAQNGRVSFDLEFLMGDRAVLTLPVVFRAPTPVDLDAFFEPAQGPDADSHVRDALDFRLVDDSGGLVLRTDDRVLGETWAAVDFAVGYSIEIQLEGRTLARSGGAAEISFPVMKDWRESPLTFEPGGEAAIRTNPDRLTATVTSDWTRAADELALWPFAGTGSRAWKGSFTVPIKVRAD